MEATSTTHSTTDVDIEKISEKIQKLLALSESSNPAEASLALTRANELLAKYNLSLDDLSKKTVVEMLQYGEVSPNVSTWKIMLIGEVASHNMCKSVVQTNRYYSSNHIIGKKHNVEAVREMCDYLIPLIEKIAKVECKGLGKTFSNNFKIGFVTAISKRLEEARYKMNAELQAVVLREDVEVKQYMSELSTTKMSIGGSWADDEANWAGYLAGHNVSLTKPQEIES